MITAFLLSAACVAARQQSGLVHDRHGRIRERQLRPPRIALARGDGLGGLRVARALVLGLRVPVGAHRVMGDPQGDAPPRVRQRSTRRLLQRKLLRSPSSWTHSHIRASSPSFTPTKPSSGSPPPSIRQTSSSCPTAQRLEDGSVTLAFTCAGLRVLGVDYRRRRRLRPGHEGTRRGPRRCRATASPATGRSTGVGTTSTCSSGSRRRTYPRATDLLAKVNPARRFGWAVAHRHLSTRTRSISGGKPLNHRRFRGRDQPTLGVADGTVTPTIDSGGEAAPSTPSANGAPSQWASSCSASRTRPTMSPPSQNRRRSSSHGSFVVVRKLAQDLARHRELHSAAVGPTRARPGRSRGTTPRAAPRRTSPGPDRESPPKPSSTISRSKAMPMDWCARSGRTSAAPTARRPRVRDAALGAPPDHPAGEHLLAKTQTRPPDGARG